MIHEETMVVRADDCRINTNGKCFYCASFMGQEHERKCVCRKRTIVARVTIDVVHEVPESWDSNTIQFHFGGSSWCSDNIMADIEEMHKRTAKDGYEDGDCICGMSSIRYLREATPEEDASRYVEFEPGGGDE